MKRISLAMALVALLLSSNSACVPEDYVGSPLGTVVVGPGQDIHIRSLKGLTGLGVRAIPPQRGVALAIADYGPIKGHFVTMGAGLDSFCTAEGGAAGADTIIGDKRVAGVIGTFCSVAAITASPLLSEAGLVMISPTNTAPSLTSDLRGNAGAHYHPGYYRTASNDLHMGQAVARFVYNELGLRQMSAVNDGDPYTVGLTDAFSVAFADLGGRVVSVTWINRGDTDMVPVLYQAFTHNAQGIFFPLFPQEAAHLPRQAMQLENLVLVGVDSLLLAAPDAVGVYIAAPDLRFGSNVNEATGKNGEQVIADYVERYRDSPTSAFLMHAYDATTLLLRAIEEVAVEDGGTLYINRTGLRDALNRTTGFNGLIGEITCDRFGDCGTGDVVILHHTDPSVTDILALPVVYRYQPVQPR